MKRISMPLFTLMTLFPILSSGQENQDPFIKDFLTKWQNAHEYTMEFAEAMPADLYSFKPTKDQRAFNEQLTHMCGNMIWLSTAFLDGEGLASADEEHAPSEKDEVIDLLNETFEYVARTVGNFDMTKIDDKVDFFAGPMTKRRVFFLIADHLTHHRGQLAVYLRLNDITPPRYRGW